MDKQLETNLEFSFDQFALRDLLDTEIAMIGGGEVVITDI